MSRQTHDEVAFLFPVRRDKKMTALVQPSIVAHADEVRVVAGSEHIENRTDRRW